MALINITSTAPEDLFKRHEFPVLPAGKHLFVVAKKLSADINAESGNKIVKLEARCQDDDANKGMVILHNFVLVDTPTTEKQAKTKAIHDPQFAQFTVACGVLTVDEMKQGLSFDLDSFEGKVFQAMTKVSMENVFPQELDAIGQPIKRARAQFRQFLFEQPK